MATTGIATAADGLRARMAGELVLPGDRGWDAAREVFNLTLDIRPAAVALPRDADDVAAVVGHARAHGLRVAPQATGHNAGPHASLDDTILLDVRRLQEVSIDPGAHRVRAGAGVKWERVTPALSEMGLAALHGSSPDVGIAGYSLGGGMGWLARAHGLQCNSVTALELVTADGRLVRADHDHHPDLFWALRGGNGNFGVVTAIEFRVYPVEDLYAGVMFFPLARADEVLHAWAAGLAGLPDELMTWASMVRFPDLPDVPPALRGGEFSLLYGAFLGSEAEGRELLRPIRDLGPAMDTFAMVPSAALGDMAMDPPDPLPFRLGHQLLGELPGAAVDDLVATAGAGSGSSLTIVELRHMGGALSQPAPGAGARATLPGEVCMVALGIVGDDTPAPVVESELAAVERVLLPHRVGDYPNFVETPADASAFFDPGTWARLRRVKAAWDPDDLFAGNHRIPPA